MISVLLVCTLVFISVQPVITLRCSCHSIIDGKLLDDVQRNQMKHQLNEQTQGLKVFGPSLCIDGNGNCDPALIKPSEKATVPRCFYLKFNDSVFRDCVQTTEQFPLERCEETVDSNGIVSKISTCMSEDFCNIHLCDGDVEEHKHTSETKDNSFTWKTYSVLFVIVLMSIFALWLLSKFLKTVQKKLKLGKRRKWQ